MEISRDRAMDTSFLSQEKYIKKVLERFDKDDNKRILTSFSSLFRLLAT